MTTYHRRSLSQHQANRFVVVTVAMVLSITFNMSFAPVWAAGSASIARGGRLYDHWQKETDAWPPISRHPAYPKEASKAAVPAVNWRCKEYHGWDYKGVDGVYGKEPHRTGI
jgi:hypothetical protein